VILPTGHSVQSREVRDELGREALDWLDRTFWHVMVLSLEVEFYGCSPEDELN
jgi:hypothetical protein